MFRRLTLIASALALAAAGCQTFQRRPLKLADYADAWRDRPIDLQSIRDYAESLAESDLFPAPFDTGDGLNLLEAEAVALHFNPQLRVERAAAEVPLASAREAGWWPDPRFEVRLLRFADRGEKARLKLHGPSIDGVNATGLETTSLGVRSTDGDFIDDPWIVGAGLNITLPVSGRLAAETDHRWSQYSAAWRRILVREWELLTEFRAEWLQWSACIERLRITSDYIGRLETIVEMTEQLVAAGEMKPTVARLLQIELASRRADTLSFERNEHQARLTLLSLMGLAANAPVTLHPKLSIGAVDLPATDRETVLTAHHPRVKSAEADYEITQQRLQLEVRRQYPDLDVGPSYSLEEGLTRFGFGIGFAVPLWNRNRQAIAEAVAAREAARAQAEVTIERALHDLAQVEARYDYASRRKTALLENVAPLVEKQVEESQALLELGEVDVLLLRDALSGSLNTKLAVLDAALDQEFAANELQQVLQPRWFTPSQAQTEEKER